jgi:hypothetical protein
MHATLASGTDMSSHVWYVSYGSNMASARLATYLGGGVPVGGSRRNPGARDATPPLRDMAVDLPGALFFAGHSPQWGGGVAFYDHTATDRGPTCGRAYLVTQGQFADVAAQEMYRSPTEGDPVEVLLAGLGGDPAGPHRVGPGRYETLVDVGRRDGVPMLCFTATEGIDDVEHQPPSPAYAETLAVGLRESRGWSDDRVSAYLDRCVHRSR